MPVVIWSWRRREKLDGEVDLLHSSDSAIFLQIDSASGDRQLQIVALILERKGGGNALNAERADILLLRDDN